MTLKEEREYNITEEKLVYKADQKKWEASHPWIKDPRTTRVLPSLSLKLQSIRQEKKP